MGVDREVVVVWSGGHLMCGGGAMREARGGGGLGLPSFPLDVLRRPCLVHLCPRLGAEVAAACPLVRGEAHPRLPLEVRKGRAHHLCRRIDQFSWGGVLS